MSRHRARARITKPAVCRALGPVFCLLWAIAVPGQETGNAREGSMPGGPYPRLPGAVTKAPDWIGNEAPFDVARFFAAPPRDRNAAPLYLDALFEFGSELESCYPAGPARDRRSQDANDRGKRYRELDQQLQTDPKSVSGAAIDDVIKLYDAGFRKVAEAQRREQCVFESGQGFSEPLPHIQVARQVARITSLRVRRAVEKRDFIRAVRDVESLLRLTRDLRPRGPAIGHLVAAAITQFVSADLVATILAGPGLRVEHCDRLIKVLAGHDAKSSDGYSEGMRAEYVAIRSTIRDLIEHQPELFNRLRLKPGQSVVAAMESLAGDGPVSKAQAPGGQTVPSDKPPEDMDARVARTTPAELARHVALVGRYYQTLLDLDGVPYAARLEKIAATTSSGGDDPLSRILSELMNPNVAVPFARATSRATATLHATECLVALRRWQLSHKGSPHDLASVVHGAGMRDVPADPYDGKPMRLAVVEGQPAVYSVGRDGKDDGGQKDSKFDVQPGDLIYRLAAMQVRK